MSRAQQQVEQEAVAELEFARGKIQSEQIVIDEMMRFRTFPDWLEVQGGDDSRFNKKEYQILWGQSQLSRGWGDPTDNDSKWQKGLMVEAREKMRSEFLKTHTANSKSPLAGGKRSVITCGQYANDKSDESGKEISPEDVKAKLCPGPEQIFVNRIHFKRQDNSGREAGICCHVPPFVPIDYSKRDSNFLNLVREQTDIRLRERGSRPQLAEDGEADGLEWLKARLAEIRSLVAEIQIQSQIDSPPITR